MEKLEVQKFLESGKSFEDLDREFFISSKFHPDHPNLVLLKYSQIESPMGDRIVQECRGIILDINKNYQIVSRAFDKFFNHGEGHAAKIDWATAKVQEKLDGSMMVVYPYEGRWLVQSSGSPNAGGQVGNESLTFAEYFWQTAKKCNLILPSPENTNYCFTFELMGPLNRVVVSHNDNSIVLTGCRNLENQHELEPEYVLKNWDLNVSHVKSFPLGSVEDIISSFEHISPLSQEGYVVVGPYGPRTPRLKIKHPGYVAIHHAKDVFSKKNFLEVIRSGESSEFGIALREAVTQFPEAKIEFDEVQLKFNELHKKIQHS